MVAGREVTPKDARIVERGKTFWAFGRGASLIRWGEPGDFMRCVEQTSRFLGPEKAKGYCENLHEMVLGMSTAEHAKLDRAGHGDVKPKKH